MKANSKSSFQQVQLVGMEENSKSQALSWKNNSALFLFLVEKSGNLIGIFSNLKKLLEALEYIGLENCHIHGKRKRKVTLENIETELKTNQNFCKIWNEEKVAFRIWKLGLNHLNPKFIKHIL